MKKLIWFIGLVLLGGVTLGSVLAQDGRSPITTDNADAIIELMRIGRGTTDRVAYAPDGQTIAVASTVGVWLYPANDLGTGAEPPLLPTKKPACDIAYAPDGSLLALGADTDIQIWDPAAQEMLASFQTKRSCEALAFSPDGSLLALHLGGGGLVLWDMLAGAEKTSITATLQTDGRLVFSPDGSVIAGSTSDNSVRLWSSADLSEVALLQGHTRWVYDFVFSPDGALLVSASYDKTVRVWDIASGSELALLQGSDAQPVDSAYALAASPDGALLVSGHAKGLMVVWDLNSGGPARVFGPQVGNIVDLAFSPDGSRIVTVSSEAAVQFWDAASGEAVAAALDHTPTMLGAIFSPDSATLAIVETNKNLWLWDTASMPALHELTPLPGLSYSGQRVETMLAYSSDGSVLATTEGFDVILIDASTGEEIRRFKGCAGTVASFAFSPDNSLLAEASSTGLCVYDIVADTLKASFSSNDWLNSVAFSPDQTLIAVASKDHTVRVYGLR